MDQFKTVSQDLLIEDGSKVNRCTAISMTAKKEEVSPLET